MTLIIFPLLSVRSKRLGSPFLTSETATPFFSSLALTSSTSFTTKLNGDYLLIGGFVVYDAEGMVVNFSKATSNHSVVLPKGGMIVFGGAKGDVLKINLQNK